MRTLIALSVLALPLMAEESLDRSLDAKAIAKQITSKDPDEAIAGIRAAANVRDSVVTSPLIKALKSKFQPVRKAAIESLARRKNRADQKKAARALAARLGRLGQKEETRDELTAVVQALHDLAQNRGQDGLQDRGVVRDRHDEGPLSHLRLDHGFPPRTFSYSR